LSRYAVARMHNARNLFARTNLMTVRPLPGYGLVTRGNFRCDRIELFCRAFWGNDDVL